MRPADWVAWSQPKLLLQGNLVNPSWLGERAVSRVISKTKVNKLREWRREPWHTCHTSDRPRVTMEGVRGQRKRDERKKGWCREEDRRVKRERQWRKTLPRLQSPQNIWNEIKDKGKQREPVVWNTKEWTEEQTRAAVCDPLGIGQWGMEGRGMVGVRFCYFSLSWSIWFARPCSLNTLPPSSPYHHFVWYSRYSATHVDPHRCMHISTPSEHLMRLNIATYLKYW